MARRLAMLRARRGPDAWRRCEAVRRLVVVCSSSRGGSTAFGELLRSVPGLVHTSAEINPHVVIPTLRHTSADLLCDPSPVAASGEGLRVLQTELGLDLGRPGAGAAAADDVAWRLTVQWPAEPIDADAVGAWVRRAEQDVGSGSHEAAFLSVLQQARRHHPSINPLAYDLDAGAVTRIVPDVKPPAPPPQVPVIEMAPFVVPRPWVQATEDELARLPVVLVTPRNAFRLPLLQAAFPNAEIRVIHLVRNPAAAVNGLMDGWCHHGFFSTLVDATLDIAGYTDRYPRWGATWWCFDLPPGWRGWTGASLAEVCSFQWAASHRATMEAVSRLRLECLPVRFEDLVSSTASRRRTLMTLAAWLGVDADAFAHAAIRGMPVVMPTLPPRPGRWRDRRGELATVVHDADMRSLAIELGYDDDPAAWR